MIVGMRLEDIGGMERLDPIDHHSSTDTPHDSDRQARVMIFFGRDVVDAVRREELQPKIDLTVIHGDWKVRLGILDSYQSL
jgi:hypothetical protein